jgi:hypothetical protein
MKRIISILLLVAIIAGVLCVFSACSNVETDNDVKTSADGKWQYRVETAEVSTNKEKKKDEYVKDGFEVVKEESKSGKTVYSLKRVRCYLTAYLGQEPDVVVPAKVDDYDVYDLDAGLFGKVDDGSGKRRDRDTYTENATLVSVRFEFALKDLPARAFYMCTSLTSVEIPETCETLGDFAFYGCSSLESISIPASVKHLGAYTFRQCGKLTNVYIHNAESATTPPAIGEKCFFMVNSGLSSDDQYYVLDGLKIWVDNIAVFDKTVIEESDKVNHTTDYKYWLEYLPDKKHPNRNYIFNAKGE